MKTLIEKNSRVQCNRDLRHYKKGSKGTVFQTEMIDSELYLHIEMDDGTWSTYSCENCWDLITEIHNKV